MKQLNTLQKIIRNKTTKISAALTIFFMSNSVYAQKLTNAKNALTELQTDLKTLIPIAAAVILLCLAIGYAGRYIGKDTFVRWAIGVVIAGSAAELANMLFKNP
ncbi:VirB2 family type IV secretion system major pilin TrwL [Bartonella grahamii]|uniref:VirB2 family type IV secretion system major pilin TrwL n=1 Tax=Bartonella grahamii TaxID=33045 RepID=UPI002E7B4D93|nr:VirB2 family type IV secretion system major pilin TrwL [Bartonella grahamii]